MAFTTTAPTPVASLRSRKDLRDYFDTGKLPTAQNFADFIESSVNRVDDGFGLAPDYGLQLAASPTHGRLATFYPTLQAVDAQKPAWFVELAPGAGADTFGLNFLEAQPAAAPDAPPVGISHLHLAAGGRVGIGTTAPAEQLEVQGFVASQGRVGTYADNPAKPANKVKADGEWHPILTNLDGLHAFEIVAAAYGPVGRGRYAITHATALSAFGKSRSQIFRRNAWFWGLFQKIQFRWTGELHSYGLDIRTGSSFGADAYIVYHITNLFNDQRPA